MFQDKKKQLQTTMRMGNKINWTNLYLHITLREQKYPKEIFIWRNPKENQKMGILEPGRAIAKSLNIINW